MKKFLLFFLATALSAFSQANTGGNVPFYPGAALLSQKVVYTSKISGVTGGVAVVPGSSAVGTTDSATAINAAISGGNVDLEVDSGYALSTSLVLSSNTTIHCIAPQYGFIMQAAANTPVLINAHTNAPTTTNATSGYLVSNIGDTGITVKGCTLNANSTQAVTGTNSRGTAHSATPGGIFVMGVEFYAVNGLVFDNNEVYDSGAIAFFGSNDEYVQIDDNYMHQPLPIVAFKFTGGYQLDGPVQYVEAHGNKLNGGDDMIAFNADDGQVPGSGDPNASYIKSFVKWGNETDIDVHDETFVNADFGVRLLSTKDLEDRIQFHHISGLLCGNTITLQAAYPGVGLGNIGTVLFDGWNAITSGSCNNYSQPFNLSTSMNIQSLQLAGFQFTNPGVNWPAITQSGGAIGILSLRDWDLNTQTSGFSNVVSTTGGSIGQLAASGINWNDSASNTSAFFSGSIVPAALTVSNYAGPNRLLASGYSPIIKNGDAFTNIYSTTTTYINTTFNEASSGTLVAGTTPSTCTNGCVGPWTASSGGPSGAAAFTYGTNSASISGICTSGGADIYCPVTINPGQTNYTMRTTISSAPAVSWGWVLRWTNNTNFVTWVAQSANTFALCDVVAGVTTCGSGQALTQSNGVWTLAINGTTVSLTNPSGTTVSGTISASNTSGGAGLNLNQSSYAGTPVTATAFSIKSN